MPFVCRRFSLCCPLLLLIGFFSLVSVPPANGATLVVNTTADSNDGAGSCASGTCSLRDAISQAAAGDTIMFSPSVTGTITLTSTLPAIFRNLTIDGPGVNTLTISGANSYQVFVTVAGTALAINNLTIANASNNGTYGAGIENSGGTLTLDHLVLINNAATGGNGYGGAIFNEGTLNVTNTTFSGNSAAQEGGTIINSGTVNISSSAFLGNIAPAGAIIYNYSGSVAIGNSTFYGNTTSAAGNGGIFNNSGASLAVTNATFVSNNGVGIDNNSGTLTITNSLLDTSSECSGTGCPTATDSAAGNVVGNLNLSGIGFHGGFTESLFPQLGSSAICAGLLSDFPGGSGGTDQRGFGPDLSCSSGQVDAGAVQANFMVVNTTVDPGFGSCSSTSCSLHEAIVAANAAGHGDIAFSSALSGSTITLTGLVPAITGTVNISGPGANLLTISGGGQYQIFAISGGGSLELSGLTLANASTASSGSALILTSGLGGIGYGGAVFNDGGTLDVSQCTFSSDSAGSTTASGEGGAILNLGTLDVTQSEFSGNSAASSGGFGGAITNTATMTVSDSTFKANTASSGSAIYDSSNAPASVTYSTFTTNTATAANAGAITVATGVLTLTNITVSGNSGGGVYSSSGTTLNIANSILGDSCGGAGCPTSGGGNNYGGGGLTLSPLGNYGGLNETMVPLPGSSAICAGLQSYIPTGVTTDQRGYPNTNSTYTGYTATAPCVDAGAVQTAYTGVQWVQQPSDTSINTTMSPAPTVEVLETNPTTNTTDAVNGIPVALTLNGSGTLSGGSANTSGGLATFSTLSVNTAGTGDTLSTNALTVVTNGSGTTTLASQASNAFNIFATPTIAIQISAVGSFTQGSTAQWLVTVSNAGTGSSTSGTAYFADTLPTGFTVNSFGTTTGWSCSGAGTQSASCTITQTVAAGGSYPSIQLVVNVPANSPTSVSDTAYAWGGGDSAHTNLGNAASATSVVNIQAEITLTADNATLTYSSVAQTTTLIATVTSSGGTVNEGSVAFTVLSGGAPVGTAVSAPVSSGTASVPYAIPAGTAAGTYTIQAAYSDSGGAFAPGSDTSHTLTIIKAIPIVTWPAPASITYGTALSSAQLDATANVSGTFAYTPGLGTVLSAGTQILSATFTPGDTTDYSTATATVQLAVNKAPSIITWSNPAGITYGTPLSSTQLNATANVSGMFAYTPGTGTVLSAGTQMLSVVFTPGDATDYNTATATVQIVVNKATPIITWTPASSITYGTTLAGVLDAAASQGGKSVNGTFSYTAQPSGGPAATVSASTLLNAGSYALLAIFVPSDAADYNNTTASAALSVTNASLTVSANNASRLYGTGNPAFTGSVSGAVNGDTFTEAFATSATISSSVGQYPIVPTVSGVDLSNYSVVLQNGTLTITKAGSSTALSVSSPLINPGGSVTLSATVKSATTGTPTGTVSFYDGTTLLNTVNLSNGTVSYSTTGLSAGLVHSITATYNGDLNFDSSKSSSLLVTVVPLSFTLAANPGSLSGTAGTSFSYQITIAPTFGSYPGIVRFTATGVPSGSNVSFSPAFLEPDAGAQVITMNVSTATSTTAANRPMRTGGGLVPAVLALLLLPVAGARKIRREGRRLNGLLCLLLLALSGIAAATTLTGCGSKAMRGFSQYTINVMATSGSIQQSTTVGLNLQ